MIAEIQRPVWLVDGQRDLECSGMLGGMAEVVSGRLRGVLVVESFRPLVTLTDLDLTVSALSRIQPAVRNPGQPVTWSLIDFEADESAADRLAAAFAETLELGPWYVDFHTATTTYVVFSGRIFSYPRSDPDGRDRCIAYARAVGVPDSQLDWDRHSRCLAQRLGDDFRDRVQP